MLKYILMVLVSCCLMVALPAQFLVETFDANLTDGGFFSAEFVFAADGTASAAADWNNRSRLRSASEGGAAVLVGPANAGRLLSGSFDANGTELYLSFYHYFRSEGGSIQVRVLDNGGVPVFTTTIVPNVQSLEETSAGKFEIIDISDALAGGQPLQLEFSVIGGAAFWLLDDITVTGTRPAYPTFPRYFGERLTDFAIPFVTDSLGSAAVPYELVIDFVPTATQTEKDDILQALGAVRKQTCVCDRLEVWELPGGNFFDPATGEPLGDPGEILERTLGSGPAGEVDNIELNLLNYNELQNEPAGPNDPLTDAMIAGFDPAPTGAIKIVVLDTGLDLDHPSLDGYVFRSIEALDGDDGDSNCYTDDAVGWNFVDNNNNPSDDHSHGTHVAGIIAQNLGNCANCVFQIIPYKTHSSYGVGTLFATACATLQASVNEGADVINASWGFYGGGSAILRAAIDTAGNYGTLVVAAAGNDSLNLVADFQHPATFTLPEIISVGAFSGSATAPVGRADFSNYNPTYIDLFAPGINIVSAVPDDEIDTKTGTSMSTPAVAAAAALRTCDDGRNPAATKSFLLGNANTFPVEIGEFVLNGNVLNLGDLCPEIITTDGVPANADFSICLSEDGEEIDVKALRPSFATDVQVVGGTGVLVANQENVNFAAGENITLSLAGQPAGNYFVVITKGDRTLVQRLVKR